MIPVLGKWLRAAHPRMSYEDDRYYCPMYGEGCGEISEGRLGCSRRNGCAPPLWPIQRLGNGAAHQRITESIEPLLNDLNERVQRLENR